MKRRAFTAPAGDMRCRYDINLRADKSPARCMRRSVVDGLCRQHAKIVADFHCGYCGGNDEIPPSHCTDCTRPKDSHD